MLNLLFSTSDDSLELGIMKLVIVDMFANRALLSFYNLDVDASIPTMCILDIVNVVTLLRKENWL